MNHKKTVFFWIIKKQLKNCVQWNGFTFFLRAGLNKKCHFFFIFGKKLTQKI